jgi:hypothetical protein
VSDGDVKWFCAECEFVGSEDDVKEHGRTFQHEYGASEVALMADFGVMSMGVTGCPPEGTQPTWVHANRCPRPGCPNPILEDDEVWDHIRGHALRGE